MTQFEMLRAESERQFQLIAVQQQKSNEADEALDQYLWQQADRILDEGIEKYGADFLEIMSYQVEKRYSVRSM